MRQASTFSSPTGREARNREALHDVLDHVAVIRCAEKCRVGKKG